ncbi:MAG: DNA-binding protein [Gammaproteobacteria bacterium]|nr:DNA-binding protein [Gammaproteobacteria bacterium]
MKEYQAGQDPENYSYVSRSIRLDGQVTSVRLEGLYWSVLDEVAESQGFTTPGFISKLHREVMELQGAPQNFTSLLRSACLIYMDNRLATRMEDLRQLKAS